jgi:MFS family permease
MLLRIAATNFFLPLPASPVSSQPPAGAGNIFAFAAFNALSFQMIIGSPMVLYAKSLDASATTLGLIAGMLPILVILQIPAARFVDAAGYKKFVLSGWSIRTVFVALMVLVPLSASVLSPGARLGIVLVLLFCFNVSRGISSCGWLPWIASIIPESTRGRFLTREGTMVNLASFTAFWLAAFVLGGEPRPWHFASLFLFSAVCAGVSLIFLRAIPAETRVEAHQQSKRPRLTDMLKIRPFRRLLQLNVVWALANGGVLTFLVAWLKTEVQMPEHHILMLSSVIFVGALLNQLFVSRILDRFGSRPVLMTGLLVLLVLLATWTAITGGVLNPLLPLIAVMMLVLGIGGSMVNLANLRLAMLTVPEIGRSHYFAVFSVVTSVSLGVAPMLWGVLVDAVSGLSRMLGSHFELNAWSLLFALMTLLFAIAFLVSTRLEEPKSVRWEALMRLVMNRSRVRYWLRPFSRSTPRS